MHNLCSYWTLLILDPSGRGYRPKVLSQAKGLIEQQFVPDALSDEFPDEKLQSLLYSQLQIGEQRAELSLRCCISEYIVLACRSLLKKFTSYQLEFSELLSCVLDDTGSLDVSVYQSTGERILISFSPESGTLKAWSIRLIKQHPEVSLYLKDHGILLLSNWGLLNDTKPSRLRHILTDFHSSSESEIETFCAVLTVYRSVYLSDRLENRLKGSRCSTPSEDQLERMAALLQTSLNRTLRSEDILAMLHQIAQWLRTKRLHRTGPSGPLASLDIAETRDRVEAQAAMAKDSLASGAAEFRVAYKSAFKVALKAAVAQAIDQQLKQYKTPRKQQQYLQAMELSHCQQVTMAEIAATVGLEKQYQVSRLLKLKQFRSNIAALMLQQLRQDVPELAAAYIDANQLIELEQQIQAALEEQIGEVMQEADQTVRVQKSRAKLGQLAQEVCHYFAQAPAYSLKA